MTLRRLGILQWLGLLLGAGVWTAQHVVGLGIAEAYCGAGGTGWGISKDLWQTALAASAAALVLVAGAAAVVVFTRTRGVGFGDGPPSEEGEQRCTRLHFFAAASIAANTFFLLIIVLDGVASVAAIGCRQS